MAIKVAQLTYLWSPEIWAVIRSKWFRWSVKLPLLFAIAVTAGLIATVGPASAACMIPRSNIWPLGSADLLINATEELMFPTNLSITLYNEPCNLDIFGVAPESSSLAPGLQGTCTWAKDSLGLSSLLTLPLTFGRWTQSWLLSNSSTVSTADWSIYRARPSVSGSDATDFLQPTLTFAANITPGETLVYYTSPNYVSTSVQAMGLWPYTSTVMFPWVNVDNVYDALSRVELRSSPVWWNLSEPQPSFSFISGQPNVTSISSKGLASIREDLKNIPQTLSAYNSFRFVDLGSNDSTYGMILVSGNATYGSVLPLRGLWLTPVSFQVGWAPSTWQQRINAISSNASLDVGHPSFRKARVSEDWINTINPPVGFVNTTLYNYYNTLLICPPTDGNLDVGDGGCPLLSAFYGGGPTSGMFFLSTLLTTTLAKMTPQPMTCDNWAVRSPIDDTTVPACVADASDLAHYVSKWSMQLYRSGYGYGPDVLAVRISLAILMLYCAITLAHIGYSVGTGLSSSSWDSVSELMALCVNSRVAPELQNTCAGIKLSRVYGQRVRVAATNGETAAATNAMGQNQRQQQQQQQQLAGGGAPQPQQPPAATATHLELLFDSGEPARVSAVVVNEEYGLLVSGCSAGSGRETLNQEHSALRQRTAER